MRSTPRPAHCAGSSRQEAGKQTWVFKTAGESRFTARGLHGATPATEWMPDPFDVFLSSPTIVGDALFFGSGDHNVYALDAATGQLRWKFATGNVVHASTSDGWLHAMDAATGTITSEFQSEGSKENAVKYIDKAGHIRSDALYPDVTHDGLVIGVHRMFTLGSMLSSPVVANGIPYIGSTDGNVYALK